MIYLENCNFVSYMVTIVWISVGIFGMAVFIDNFFANKILERIYEYMDSRLWIKLERSVINTVDTLGNKPRKLVEINERLYEAND